MSINGSSYLATSDGDMDVDTDSSTVYGDRETTPRPELVNESAPINIMPLLTRLDQRTERYDVCIVGAGPAGLMLG